MFKPRPRNAETWRERSPAQKRAIERNFLIFRLRGLYFHAFLLSGKRRERMKALIDAELTAMGAESQTDRIARERAAYEAEGRRQTIINKLLTGEKIK